MIDDKTGNFSNLWLTDAISPDQRQIFTAIEPVQAGELMLFDLGDSSQDAFKIIADRRAFFLCLLNTQLNLYRQTELGDIRID